jgi:hypothetical protein
MKPRKTSTPRLLHSRRDAADILGISIRAIDYLIASQQLATRVIGRRRLIPDGELTKYARRDHPGPIIPPESRRASGASSRPEHNDVDPHKPQGRDDDRETL